MPVAFISEISFMGSGEGPSDEFVEITIHGGEDLSNFLIGFYDADGFLGTSDGSGNSAGSSFFPGVSEFSLADIVAAVGGDLADPTGTLSSSVGGMDLVVSVHPDNPDWLVFVVPASTVVDYTSSGSPSASFVTLTNTSSDIVIDAFDVGNDDSSAGVVLQDGAAAGTSAETTNTVWAGSSQWSIYGDETSAATTAGDSVLCLARGTKIKTPCGETPVENLRPGDLVQTLSHGNQEIIWIGNWHATIHKQKENPNMRPVCICHGALGDGLPSRDIYVTANHRILIDSKIAKRMFGQDEVLVHAKHLVGLPGITRDMRLRHIEFFHFLTRQHEVIFADSAAVETVFTGPQTLLNLPQEAILRLKSFSPELFLEGHNPIPACYFPPNTAQKSLAKRHVRNSKPLQGNHKSLCIEVAMKPEMRKDNSPDHPRDLVF